MNTEKEQRAIKYLKAFEPKDEPYYLCYSGGKDSDAIRILAKLADVKHDIVHNLTTVDAPETVRYVKSIPGVIIRKPEYTMWELIVKNMCPPTRFKRYCCSVLKEQGGKGRLKITGVRWNESPSRKESSDIIRITTKPKTTKKAAEKQGINYRQTRQGGVVLNDDNADTRRFVEHCYRTASTMINPIVDWTTEEVWEFLHHYGCDSNPLYQCGFSRIGCIGCPIAGKKKRVEEFEIYPKYKQIYIHAFDRMLEARKAAGKDITYYGKDGEEIFEQWIGLRPYKVKNEEDNL